MLRRLLEHRHTAAKALVVLPYVSVVVEKANDLQQKFIQFGYGACLKLSTGLDAKVYPVMMSEYCVHSVCYSIL